jgi:uncharacterized protein
LAPRGVIVNATIQPILAELREGLQALYGPRLTRLVLFGSHARGDAAADSDIDVLVVLDGDVRPGEEIARAGAVTAGLSLKHNCLVSTTFISAGRFESEKSPLMVNVRREGVVV